MRNPFTYVEGLHFHRHKQKLSMEKHYTSVLYTEWAKYTVRRDPLLYCSTVLV